MSFLLKIVEGPSRGAEIALAEGLRVSVGSGDDCDIVLADGSLAAKAFELDVTPDSVTLVKGEETETLAPFAPFSVGTSTFAVGPADGDWPTGLAELVRETREKPAAPAAPTAGTKEVAEATETKADSDAAETDRKHQGRGCLVSAVIFFVVLLLLSAALYFLWPKIAASCPAAEKGRVTLVEKSRAVWNWAKDSCRRLKAKCEKVPPVVVPGPSLAEIAAQYGLSLSEKDGAPLLSGNLRRRTERLAIRSLAQADNPAVRFDLTDDESLRSAANELLFVVTEGALKAVTASNRVVTLEGGIPTAAALEKAVRALAADVKGVERLDTTGVIVGGPAPTAAATPSVQATRTRTAKASSPDYPIAGILTAPYPCVVLRNGLRLTEGASIGTALLVKIEADKLTLKDGGATVEWKP